ncbi:MAG: hypothetical protein Q8P81_03780 [Nanoarchaeota archaeon]|nr:hypothetical protein [Nanoarchaeota archaeon]
MAWEDVPESVTVFLDAEYTFPFGRSIDSFFEETQGYIERIHDQSRPHDFRIKSGELSYHPGSASDDRVTFMLYDDIHVVAGVLETRTPFNNVRYTFFRQSGFLERLFNGE